MATSTHSPGPWHVDAVMSEALHDICMSNPPPGQGNPVLLASLYYDTERDECPSLAQANANARLMAAAPELLAALKLGLQPNALGCLFSPQADDPHVCCCGKPEAYHWKAFARAAISKAERR